MIQFNYGEYIFQQLILTEFVQQKLSFIFIALITNILQIHIVSVLSYLISINYYVDFVIQIVISVSISLNINYIYDAVQRYQKEFMLLTQYLINNYSFENYRYWKRIIVLSSGTYLCILLFFIKITNLMLISYIIQYLICFLIIEQFEQKRIHKLIKEYRLKPVEKKYTKTETQLIESYISPKKMVKSSSNKHCSNIIKKDLSNSKIIQKKSKSTII
jgi:hypothetical protein